MRSRWFPCLALVVLFNAPCGSRATALSLAPIPEPTTNTNFPDRVVALCRDFDRIANRAVTAKVKRTARIVLRIRQLEHHRPKAVSRPIQPVQEASAVRESTPAPQTNAVNVTAPPEETTTTPTDSDDDPLDDSESVGKAIQNSFSAASGKLDLLDYGGASGFVIAILVFAAIGGWGFFCVRGR